MIDDHSKPNLATLYERSRPNACRSPASDPATLAVSEEVIDFSESDLNIPCNLNSLCRDSPAAACSGTMRLGLRPELRGAGLSLWVEQLDELLPLRRGERWCVQAGLGCTSCATGQTRTSGSLDALDVLARCPGALALPARAVRASCRLSTLSRRAAALTRSEDEGSLTRSEIGVDVAGVGEVGAVSAAPRSFRDPMRQPRDA